MSETIAEKTGCAAAWEKYKNMIPECSRCVAIIILILNVIFPGSGTCVIACLNHDFLKENLIIALLQFVLAICVIGWVWSIIWGLLALCRAKPPETEPSSGPAQA